MGHHTQNTHQEMSVQTQTKNHFPATRVHLNTKGYLVFWGLSLGQSLGRCLDSLLDSHYWLGKMNHGHGDSGWLTKFVIKLS